jgi:signal transduction histidine kinase
MAPHWWPEGEPWPPADPSRIWRRRRARYFGRFVLGFGLIWTLTAIAGATIAGGRGRGGGVLVLLALVVAFVAVVRRVGWPIGDLVAAAQRIAEGDFSVRVPAHGPPTIRAVARAFNDMAERLAIQERQRRELMADIAHELRTPLSVVQGRLEGLIDGVYPRDAAQLEPILEETRVLARLVEDLRTLANAESGVLTLDREPTDIEMLVQDVAAAIRDEAAAASATLTIDDGPNVVARVDPLRFRQILLNLTANAVRHGGAGNRIALRVRQDAGSLTVRVSDSGPGIPADELPHVFDRFFKRAGSRGSGLGLAIARTLARAHGGDITVESRPGQGTAFEVRVPLN